MRFKQWFCNHSWDTIYQFEQGFDIYNGWGDNHKGVQHVIDQQCNKCGALRRVKLRC